MMNDNIEKIQCYGNYHKSKVECLECKYKQYCMDSKPPWRKDLIYNDLTVKDNENCLSDMFEERKDDNIRESYIPEIVKAVGELISLIESKLENKKAVNEMLGAFNKLYVMYGTNQKTFRVFIKKINKPYLSYSDIAKELNMKNKQLVDYHLKLVKKKYPEFICCLLIDKRFYPKSKTEQF